MLLGGCATDSDKNACADYHNTLDSDIKYNKDLGLNELRVVMFDKFSLGCAYSYSEKNNVSLLVWDANEDTEYGIKHVATFGW